jgi:UDP-N-acetylglucosamine 2-epimerase (non-hydrolysing)/GDP/UDP-N,N'-diacetylbacillosamine 2-epimerase (hydrolysing)
MKTRRICVATGTRAEYGLLIPVMRAIARDPRLELSVMVTGMHLMREFGHTVKEISADGFKIAARVPMHTREDTGAAMAKSIGKGIIGMTNALQRVAPEMLVVIADRGEALAAAIAGTHMNIPIAHIHGGDVTTGATIDEPVRHAITRFAHIHFPATRKSAQRIVRMGEESWRIHVVGPLGIYAMTTEDFIQKDELCRELRLDSDRPILLVIQHPVTTEPMKAAEQMKETMDALVELGEQAVLIYPNADAGGRKMIKVIEKYEKYRFLRIFRNLPYLTFISLMRISSAIVGNSSSAIVEAPLFGVPAVNIGIRQKGRERGGNVLDVPHKKDTIVRVMKRLLTDEDLVRRIRKAPNPFHVERQGASRIANVLAHTKINGRLLRKRLTY